MESSWYIRVRGEVLGPFELQKLQEMATRGQLSRIYEVSQDKITWERASAHPEFFPLVGQGGVIPMATRFGTTAAQSQTSSPTFLASEQAMETPTLRTPDSGVPSGAPPAGQPSPPDSLEWYYQWEGTNNGPISQTELRRKLDSRELPPNVLVWNTTLPAWCPADKIFQHISQEYVSVKIAAEASPATGDLPQSLCQTALRTRPWTLFLTIMYWISAAIWFISGLAQIIGSSIARNPFLAIGGISAAITGIVWLIYGFFMYNYTHSLRSLRYSRSPVVLQKNLTDLYNYFLFKGVIYIIGIIFTVILVIILLFLIALGSSLVPSDIPGESVF